MAQHVKVTVAKPDQLSSSTKTHIKEREPIPASYPLIPTGAISHTYTEKKTRPYLSTRD